MATNFLVFVVDQLCATHLGCYGNTMIATPNIDSLSRQGWRADNCFVASPLCMPNRASMLTGRLPSVHGVRHNGIPLSLGTTTFVDVLREAGYHTSLIGKGHLQNVTGIPPLFPPGREPLLRNAHQQFEGDYEQESVLRWGQDSEFRLQAPYYGFDHSDLVIEHGATGGGDYGRWLQKEHPKLAALAGKEHALPEPGYELVKIGQAWRPALPEALHPTAWIADRTIARLTQAKQQNQSFFTYCSFPDPHHPYTPPGRFWDMYRPEDVVLPESFFSDTPPPHLAWLREQRDTGKAVKHGVSCFAASEREVREAIALNYGAIAFIDEQVGRILQALRELNLDQDTVVVFTSDHGDFVGDHQLLLKGPLHYRSIIRTPLIWRDPKSSEGHVDTALHSTIDIAPSILERADLAGYNGIQGRSFVPSILQNEPVARDAVLIEEEGQRTILGFDAPVRLRTLVTGQLRLSLYDGVEWGELYDSSVDPNEQHNLWDSPEHRSLRDDMVLQLARTMLHYVDRNPPPSALA